MTGVLESIFGAERLAAMKPKPRGIVLAGKEAKSVITKWQEKVASLETERARIGNVRPAMEMRIRTIKSEKETEASTLSECKRNFTKVKTPLAKKKWARKLVYSKRTLDYLTDSRQLMTVNLDRANTAVEESCAVGRLLMQKIEDAKIYYELNGQIRLIGNALAAAEKMEEKTSGVEKDFEVSVEGLEELVSVSSEGDVMVEANKIVDVGYKKVKK